MSNHQIELSIEYDKIIWKILPENIIGTTFRRDDFEAGWIFEDRVRGFVNRQIKRLENGETVALHYLVGNSTSAILQYYKMIDGKITALPQNDSGL